MVPPALLCRSHLLGEHVECHMLASTLRRGRSVAGYIRNGLIEPLSLGARHDALAAEMARRGYRHASPLGAVRTGHLPADQRRHRVDEAASLRGLTRRCAECRARSAACSQRGEPPAPGAPRPGKRRAAP